MQIEDDDYDFSIFNMNNFDLDINFQNKNELNKKSVNGNAGEKKAIINKEEDIGTININSSRGLFGKYEEDRYEERGNITYMKLYQDNLNKEILRAIWNSLNVYDKVHLYKREFFGIDKECDKKYNLNEDTYDSLHSTEKMEYYLLAIEGIVVTFFSL